ncbi:hypothetical protein A2962_02990 [Candidatus Woesebacteria bacterium RIFCSPLOWO2_01_FULL_39_61]|uniref:Steroid 5-alpha reductase C-terminal domain-containing protein n=1 Tax=Candidatus Woesebacteria bacterium RIFCSPHIGHO2_02_FULL_39_13 TaxID=1802505 RepID=A0A1F7Z0L6_9BACT|nr:MAG: hypothetical protein A2692_04120 [Candidatus Woesebacteria bacterium RIFCSPHIGHO2_01_FULL_39_95]OGM33020.1 MAG: hypothetical protein A3D01_04200 [Candidatus Woesebacteria bacterium RIFCSPHIGHO2_02_FULL_39_13]OGM37879.1 MAG: hypothetical protein A3E13_04095 [Candidatus Woesebacteria bacterium RIFCSPHIGHO2_12_FULL_40_20]OGM66452.1 MAG: hypothetical protein A2962_02990 [Candidatus Woesebacteria bacterium RIFCSPLOWO2_01_FULL_39_61]OGM74815.1 MAG: hypothetical protein A3H19_01760 [Candidatus
MTKILNLLAVIIWIILASYRLRQSIEIGAILPFSLALQSGIIAYFLVVRTPSIKTGPFYQQIFSWFAVFAPVVIRIKGDCYAIGGIVAMVGTLLTLWALTSLGKSFGIAPADRKLVKKGPYKFIRHPMYSGELISLFGGVVGCISAWNIFVVLLMFITFYLRISWEEAIISGYETYKKRVRWRLLPGVW